VIVQPGKSRHACTLKDQRAYQITGGEWDGSENTDEPGFILAYWCCGMVGQRIVNPGETWSWPAFQGNWPKDWPAGKPIPAKVKFFYGGEKPAVASFELSIKSD